MNGQAAHLSADQLMVLAFASDGPAMVADREDGRHSLEHLAQCDACAAEMARLSGDADGVRHLAVEQADRVFDQRLLDAQRTRVLDRLAQLGRAARVLTFPHRSKDPGVPASSGARRWISMAAAAGLIIGLLAGQLLHFVPSGSSLGSDQPLSMQSVDRQGGIGGRVGMISPAVATMTVLTEDELMEEVEAAVERRRGYSSRALDGLTPTAADLLAPGGYISR